MATGKPREVRGFGPQSARVMFVGEAPGRDEYLSGRPFYGRSGQLQRDWLKRHDVDIYSCYLTNIVKLYQEGNPDPSYDLILSYSDQLHAEIDSVHPWLIVAVGRFAVRWFLGESAQLETVHGAPFVWPLSRSRRHHSTIILPIYHPAFGLHSAGKGEYDALSWLAWDYQRTAKYIKLTRSCRSQDDFFDLVSQDEPCDHFVEQESYIDCTGQQLADFLYSHCRVRPIADVEIALDTEGIPSTPWSVQISTSPGTAYVLRCTQPDFSIGIRALQTLADSVVLFITHQAGTPSGCMYDTIMCRAMGLELRHARIWDTMYAAYLLRTEARGLKHLAERWCGMLMEDYEALIGHVGRTKQLAYFSTIASFTDWEQLSELIQDNDSTFAYTRYQKANKYAASLLNDIAANKINADGPVDPVKRWKKWPLLVRNQIVERLGHMPHGTLDDLPLDKSIYYAGRDPDATLRLKPVLRRLLSDLYLLPPFDDAMDCLPSMEEMQRNGMPASRNRFFSLLDHVQTRMDEIQFELIHKYNEGKPLNPKSPDQIRDLMRRRRLKGEKLTDKTRKISTGKKSIEHLRHVDPAMAHVTDWREYSTIRDTFVCPSIARSNPNADQFTIRGIIQPITTESRRLSMTNPTLLNIPSRTEIGRRVRSCYELVGQDIDDPNSLVLGAWDFSGQEARVAAHISQDPDLIRIFKVCHWCGTSMPNHDICSKSLFEPPNNVHLSDIHSETSVRIFGVPFEKVDKWEHRMPCKTAFFGILNGMSGSGLLDQFRMYIPPDKDPTGHWSKLENCESLVEEITNRVYPGLSRAMAETRLELAATGMVRDLYGFPRYLPAPATSTASFADINAQVRAGFNHKIQGTAQGMTQAAQAYVFRCLLVLQSAGLDILFRLQIHDELLYSFLRSLWPTMNALVIDAMTNHYGRGRVKLCVPVEADGHMALNWGELKG